MKNSVCGRADKTDRKASLLAGMHLRLEGHGHKRKLKDRPPQHQSETGQRKPCLQTHAS